MIYQGRQDNWDGHIWIWVQSASGKAGWAPSDLISPEPPYVARYDYSAMELACEQGQEVEGLRATHGWAFCQDASGRTGWAPLKHLAPV